MTSSLVDRRTGIIRELVDAVVPQHFPPEFKLIHSYVSDSARFSPWSSDSAAPDIASIWVTVRGLPQLR